MLRIGIDIGGTFTDFVIHDPDDGSLSTFKLLTDNINPALTVLEGLSTILAGRPAQIIHGSTVATNALLERKGARTALITTRGFKDILQIGRQNRPNLYDWNEGPPPSLVPSELRFEATERVDNTGTVIKPLDSKEILAILQDLDQSQVESVAVCSLFSFLYPQHEGIIADQLRSAGYFVSVSSEILPEYREYERTSTTVVNAYVSPVLDKYLSSLQSSLPATNLQIMQSNGGMINLSEARHFGARCILSGPAGGVVGALNITESMPIHPEVSNPQSKPKVITFDMGGTSTDVSLIDGTPALTSDAIVGGCPIHLPILDIHTIGAGGGSIASVDLGGSLRVGPQSAGADPGPACYGKGELPTVTDANLVLGRLVPGYFLGGKMPIYPDRAYSAISKLGKLLHRSPIQAAFGIIDVVNIQMERALRVISVERGYDPREFSLFSFGGAGGLHACELALNLGIPRVIISRFASTLSAFGMLVSDVVKDYVQTVMLSSQSNHTNLDSYFAPLIERGIREIKGQGISDERIEIHPSLDLRYSGQSYELNIPYTHNFIPAFHDAHTFAYGYNYETKPIEIVNIRVRVIGKLPSMIQPTPISSRSQNSPTDTAEVAVHTRKGKRSIPLVYYDHLQPGDNFNGPALVVSPDTTILINSRDHLFADDSMNLIITIATPARI